MREKQPIYPASTVPDSYAGQNNEVFSVEFGYDSSDLTDDEMYIMQEAYGAKLGALKCNPLDTERLYVVFDALSNAYEEYSPEVQTSANDQHESVEYELPVAPEPSPLELLTRAERLISNAENISRHTGEPVEAILETGDDMIHKVAKRILALQAGLL